MEFWRIELAECPRLVEFPYKLLRVGSFRDWKPARVGPFRFQNELQISLRLGSEAETMENFINDTRTTNRFPHVLLKLPGDQYCGDCASPWDAVTFTYPADLYGELILAKNLERIPCWDFKMTSEIAILLRRIRTLMKHSQEKTVPDRLDLLAFQLFEELVFHRLLAQDTPDYIEAKIRKIASEFQLDFMDALDLEQVARRNGMSRSTFFRHWKRCFQEPPAKYLLNLRLKESIRMLTESDSKIHEIARALHFRDSAYFCAVFKRRYGISPMQYRKQPFL